MNSKLKPTKKIITTDNIFFNIQKPILMYRFFIMLTLSLFTYTANAQTYVPFPTGADTAVWFVGYYYAPFDYGDYNIVTDGDTIFDGLEYTKLYYSDNNGASYTYYAAIREVNKVIYLRDLVSNRHGVINFNSDTILFDFNVQVGDTANWFSFYGLSLIIDSIDSIQVADGSYRKRYNLSRFSFGGFEVIEGIGSGFGFIPEPMVGGGGTTTYCYFLNGDFVWTPWFGGTANDCYTSTKQLNSNSKITVNPNPANDNLNIEFENTEQRELMIFNQLGQMVLNETSNEVNVVLNLEQLPKGFYVLTIRTHEGIFTKKIIKN